MSSPRLYRAWKPNSTRLKSKREDRTLTLKLSTTPTKPWWIEILTLNQSMRRFKSILPFWPSKIKTFKENLTLLWRQTISWEEIWTGRKRWTIFDSTWTTPSKRVWTRWLDPDPQPSRATMLEARAGTPLNSTHPKTIDQKATTTNSRQLELSQRVEAHLERNNEMMK